MKCVFLLILLCPTHEVFQNKCCFCGAGENVCGAVLSIRFSEDIVSVWNKNASDYQAIMALRDAIKRHLKLSP
ncbi:hypothetical protein RND81_01G047100 [Saponaria officinalis]|uniref:mRNA cap-binding protein n=1 Tax=Saponaria officinalis TaxID=3572 RepID=A0AAW1N5R0_SAPOF